MSYVNFTHGNVHFVLKRKESESRSCAKCVFDNDVKLCQASPDCGATGYFKVKGVALLPKNIPA